MAKSRHVQPNSARNKLCWMTPEFGTSAKQLLPETQFLLVEVSLQSHSHQSPAHPFDQTIFNPRAWSELRCKAWDKAKLWWMTPEFGTSAQQLLPETQFLLGEVSLCVLCLEVHPSNSTA